MPSSQSPRDPYQVLGVTVTATAAELKAAYRALVKQHHPDAGGDEHRILELNAAWEVLGDAQRRADHDRLHHAGHGDATRSTTARSAAAGRAARTATAAAARGDSQLLAWFQQAYAPIECLLSHGRLPFSFPLLPFSSDPSYDPLMVTFCAVPE